MTGQLDAVRRRLVEVTCREVVEQAWPLRIFSRETIIEGLVLCDASVDQFNGIYNAWRKQRPGKVISVTIGEGIDVKCDEEPEFLDFVRRRVGTS